MFTETTLGLCPNPHQRLLSGDSARKLSFLDLQILKIKPPYGGLNFKRMGSGDCVPSGVKGQRPLWKSEGNTLKVNFADMT